MAQKARRCSVATKHFNFSFSRMIKKLHEFDHKVSVRFCSTSILSFLPIGTIILIWALSTGCSGSSSPTEPPPPPPSSTISITSPVGTQNMVPTQAVLFTASGQANWSILPSGCGTVNPASGVSTTVTLSALSAFNGPTNCTVVATNPSNILNAPTVGIQVFTQNSIEFVSANPASGSTIPVNSVVAINVNYVALQNCFIEVYPMDSLAEVPGANTPAETTRPSVGQASAGFTIKAATNVVSLEILMVDAKNNNVLIKKIVPWNLVVQ